MRLTRREFTAALTGLTGAAALRSDRPLAAGEPDPATFRRRSGGSSR